MGRRSKGEAIGREQALAALGKTGSILGAARLLSCSRGTIRYHMRRAGIVKPVAAGKADGEIRETARELPRRGVKRYIVTCAQSNTHVHERVWENLLALREYYGAELLVSRFAYNVSAYLHYNPAKPGANAQKDDHELWYDPAIEPYVCDERVELAPGLVFCGELNILPTAARPLSGFETYTGRKSSIIPHVRIAMESVAAMKGDPTKFNYTTGTVTKMNYVQKKAGQRAEWHHAYGALLVEVDASGNWWVRQLNADTLGRIYDVGDRQDGIILAHEGEVTTGHRSEAINWGDIHVDELDDTARHVHWAKGGMLDVLRPRVQFGHDTLSFTSRNHHDRGNAHRNFKKWVDGRECVAEELERAARFLSDEAHRPWCKTVVVDSNHDNALGKWLREADYKADPVNARVFLHLQARVYAAIEDGEPDFHLVEYALRKAGCRKEVRFLREDESFIICRDASGGIECGMHGHLGINGAKGSPLSLSKMGRKANTGHTHSAGILDGLYTAGTSSMLDMGYNKGPGSWSHSDIVTYPNGKRAIITIWNGSWRAGNVRAK